MRKSKNQQGGVHIVGVLLMALVLGIAFFSIYRIHTMQDRLPAAQSVAKPVVTSAVETATKGWEKYCTPYERACLKLAPGWNEVPVADSEYRLESPSGQVRLTFQAPLGEEYFTQVEPAHKTCILSVKKIQNLKGPPGLKVVQALDTPSTHSPTLFLSRELSLPPDGTSGTGICTADALPSKYHSDNHVRVIVAPVGSEYTLADWDKKRAWFDSGEVKAGWLMLQTFTYE